MFNLFKELMNTQFKKGVLELCVLALLSKRDCYGYEIVQEISESIDISEGTIYPLLRRLKESAYVTTYLEESTDGAPRKYYKITELGIKDFEILKGEWTDFTKNVDKLMSKKK
jgi:PadR family transcriptional regulator PadR